MKERLIIKNFGAIKEVDLELKPLTVLIGDNATGKSTIAKVLSVCRFFSYIVDFKNITLENLFTKGLKDIGINDFYNDQSYIEYENKEYKLVVKKRLFYSEIDEETGNLLYERFEFLPEIVEEKSDEFIKLMNEFRSLNPHYSDSLFSLRDRNWYPPYGFYKNYVGKVMNNPCYIPVERTLQSISFSKDLLLNEAIQDQLRKLERFAINSGDKPRDLNLFNLEFKRDGNVNFIKRKSEDEFYPVSSAASGFQNVTAIGLAINNYSVTELFNKKPKTFIIEEPEISLFPKGQKELMEFFVENINVNHHQFILPTHSPYILSTLYNLVYAKNVSNISKKSKKEVSKIVNEQKQIDIENVAVYALNNGSYIDLVDRVNKEINIEFIDSVSEINNEIFDKLIDIKINNEKD